ncbi:MAG TPA: metallophosphoesterase [Solirubrobacteraceae bacterium]|nr:metallophosphoesterase [Solirubrobacteraceae bacterium]
MRTLVISDLHLGSGTRADLLRRPELREALLAALADCDRLVLLGDVIELRHGPPRDAMNAARGFFGAIGTALPGLELVLVAGNHDHALIEPWLACRAEDPDVEPLGLSEVLGAEVSPGYRRISEWCEPVRVRVAYPGLWLRGDVYATHGHYLDCHLTVPTLERLSMAAMARVLGVSPDSLSSVAAYESVGAPAFAWRDAVARDARTGSALNGLATVSAWRALGGGGARRDPTIGRAWSRPRRAIARELRRRALVAAFPVAVGALNLAGLGPLRAEVSPNELRRAGLQAMGEVAARLGLGDAHVVFGHTHRPGPLTGDDASEWLGRSGTRLVNTGSWTYAPIFLNNGRAGVSPYWPGTAVLVDDHGPPVLLSLLADRSLEQIRPQRTAPAQAQA